MGRTELQDAVPMTVGQSSTPFASSLQNEIQWLKDSEKPLYVENMGATAIGPGINVDIVFADVDMEPELIDASVNAGAKGIVIAGVGNGNMNKASVEAAERAVRRVWSWSAAAASRREWSTATWK